MFLNSFEADGTMIVLCVLDVAWTLTDVSIFTSVFVSQFYFQNLKSFEYLNGTLYLFWAHYVLLLRMKATKCTWKTQKIFIISPKIAFAASMLATTIQTQTSCTFGNLLNSVKLHQFTHGKMFYSNHSFNLSKGSKQDLFAKRILRKNETNVTKILAKPFCCSDRQIYDLAKPRNACPRRMSKQMEFKDVIDYFHSKKSTNQWKAGDGTFISFSLFSIK